MSIANRPAPDLTNSKFIQIDGMRIRPEYTISRRLNHRMTASFVMQFFTYSSSNSMYFACASSVLPKALMVLMPEMISEKDWTRGEESWRCP